ncbi:Uncharacterised protein [Yersinia similis]|uniref:Uncharacterized protein n=1 Tax=Yersinia similis TaxID=367190 RepID=A0A0T9R1P2_9GAMM|nr:Uncharacterised protein [Yersinia similis]CNB94922.1 Uncharacterised protein [Yersinia similis]CNF20226.1 Uncharacterised protein [Yersinia similis]CNG24455.1 Uncharacterised protein [Yersinia similis]CNI38806.1 Uncharacterised protein [Yersinia similis]
MNEEVRRDHQEGGRLFFLLNGVEEKMMLKELIVLKARVG